MLFLILAVRCPVKSIGKSFQAMIIFQASFVTWLLMFVMDLILIETTANVIAYISSRGIASHSYDNLLPYQTALCSHLHLTTLNESICQCLATDKQQMLYYRKEC